MGRILDYMASDRVDNEMMLKNAIITLVLLVAAHFLLKLIGFLSEKFVEDERKVNKIVRTSRIVMAIGLFFYILNLWLANSNMLGFVIALILAFVAIASKDIILDIVAYVYISARRPFAINQVIEVDGICGELIDIDFLQFNLLELGALTENKTHTGRYISIPNRYIFKHPVINYNHTNPFVVVEVSVLIDFKADRNEALKIAGKVAYEKYVSFLEKFDEEAVQEFEKKMEGLGEDTKPKLRATMDPNGFVVFVQFFTAYDEIGKNKTIMQNAIYDEFVKENIKMPTPQYIRLHGEN